MFHNKRHLSNTTCFRMSFEVEENFYLYLEKKILEA